MKEVTAATTSHTISTLLSYTIVFIVTQQHPEQQQVGLSDRLLHVAGEVVLYGGLNLTYKAYSHCVDCGWVSRIENKYTSFLCLS